MNKTDYWTFNHSTFWLSFLILIEKNNLFSFFIPHHTLKVIKILLSFFGWLVSLFNGISTLFRLFNAKAILLEEQLWYYLTHSWEDKGFYTFPKGICPKVNVITRLEYELTYYNSAVHCFNHYTTRTPLSFFVLKKNRRVNHWMKFYLMVISSIL